ncbi:MAG: hypothetical protein NTV54_15050 [Ignavibacteriales bacterium]|nr:hypothetical protein [Ignavibacteriales bacterium]
MYSIERKPWGFKLTFSDTISDDEMKKWVKESQQALVGAPGKFGILVDMRNLKPLAQEAQNTMVGGQQLYKKAGMERSAVVLNSMAVTLQFKRLAKDSGIYQWERYIDAASKTNWEQVGIDWIGKGIDPDK